MMGASKAVSLLDGSHEECESKAMAPGPRDMASRKGWRSQDGEWLRTIWLHVDEAYCRGYPSALL